MPAHPGYRVALLGIKGELAGESSPPPPSDPADLWVTYDDVIAWMVRPAIRTGVDYEEIYNTEVYAVTVDGLLEQAGAYIVSPSGKWTQQGIADFDNELEARKDFIANRLSPSVTRG